MSPNLPGRYSNFHCETLPVCETLPARTEHSIVKGEERQPTAIGTFERADRVPCLGGCGLMVPPGQKCVPCATRAVDEWLAKRRVLVGGEEEAPKPVHRHRRAKR